MFVVVSYLFNLEEIVKMTQITFGNRLSDAQIQEMSKNLIRQSWIEGIIGVFLIICGFGLLRIKRWARKFVFILSWIGSIYLIYSIYLDIFIKYKAPFPSFQIVVLTILIFLIILLNLKSVKNLFYQKNTCNAPVYSSDKK